MSMTLSELINYRRFEITTRIIESRKRIVLDKPELAAAFAHPLQESPQEIMLWIAVDCRKNVVAVQDLFRGTVDSCLVHPRDVFRNALRLAPTVCGVFLVHNHPSGCCEPSQDDIIFYDKVTAAGKLLQIPVIDCLIVSEDGAWSREVGKIERPQSYIDELKSSAPDAWSSP